MSDLSQLPDADRERLVKGRFSELFQENANDPNFIAAIAKAVSEAMKSESGQGQPRPPQQGQQQQGQPPSNGGKVSAFEKYLLGR